jgi:hypothetical protein
VEVVELPNRPATFVQADIARIFRAAKEVGVPAVQIQMPGGPLITIPLNGDMPLLNNSSKNDDTKIIPL